MRSRTENACRSGRGRYCLPVRPVRGQQVTSSANSCLVRRDIWGTENRAGQNGVSGGSERDVRGSERVSSGSERVRAGQMRFKEGQNGVGRGLEQARAGSERVRAGSVEGQ